tara:strand:- start:15113 stop:16117 length:1005 start_codon:yes stop_codon:yes gene_type:complete
MKKILFLLSFPLLVTAQTSKESVSDEDVFAMFYNVENLFDTINNPNTSDDEFLPKSEKKWNTFKYFNKINQLARVFSSIIKEKNSNKMPDIIGLCEVENKQVIDDLLKTPTFSNHNYKIVHKNSPDGRGIDCALLYNDQIQLLSYDFIFVNNPKAKRATRDIVYAKLKLSDKIINVFVNHWPSRWGGQVESNYKRVFAAKTLRNFININVYEDDYTLIMGDFNDYPKNESLSEILIKDDFVNLMSTDSVLGKGSYNYKSSWNWLDQIIISKNFFKPNVKVKSVGSFQKEYMLYTDKKGQSKPSRTFGGNNWYGGFSDHLPVYFQFSFNSSKSAK